MARLTVGTFNVCGLPPRRPLLPLAQRASHLCPRLDGLAVDVLNLQEVWFYPSLRLLRAGLRSYPYVAFRRGPLGPHGGLVTFSRLPLTRPRYRPFVAIRRPAGDARLGPRQAILSAVKGVLTVDLADRAVMLVNAHLTANRLDDYRAGNRFYDFQRQQLARLDALLRRLPRNGLTVVTGDLNLPSSCDAYPLIVDHGSRRDPFASADRHTYHRAFLPPGANPLRVDYILLAGDAAVLAADTFFDRPVDLDDGQALYLSDHIGLRVEVGVADRTAAA